METRWLSTEGGDMIWLLACIGAGVGYWAVCYVLTAQIDKRDQDAYLAAYRLHGGHRAVWDGTDWDALARMGARRRAEIADADRRDG